MREKNVEAEGRVPRWFRSPTSIAGSPASCTRLGARRETAQPRELLSSRGDEKSRATRSLSSCARSRRNGIISRSTRPFRVLAPLVLAFSGRRWAILDVIDRAAQATRDVKAPLLQGVAPSNRSYLCDGRLEPGRRRSLVRESRGAHPFSLRVHAAHGCGLRWCLRCLRRRDFDKERVRERQAEVSDKGNQQASGGRRESVVGGGSTIKSRVVASGPAIALSGGLGPALRRETKELEMQSFSRARREKSKAPQRTGGTRLLRCKKSREQSELKEYVSLGFSPFFPSLSSSTLLFSSPLSLLSPCS